MDITESFVTLPAEGISQEIRALGGDKNLLFQGIIPKCQLCVKKKMTTTSGHETELRLRGFSGKWLEERP
jgi:hypothetical protein